MAEVGTFLIILGIIGGAGYAIAVSRRQRVMAQRLRWALIVLAGIGTVYFTKKLWPYSVVVLIGGVVYVGWSGLFGWSGRVVVPTDHIGIVRRRYGPADPVFRRIAPGDTRGVQARTLLPDRTYLLTPGRYSVEFVPRVHIPEGMVGLVDAQEGRNRPKGRPYGRNVECDDFQDGQAFLLGGGEQGPQVATLAGGQAYYINTHLFKVTHVPRTYVPDGTVGLVIAKVGAIRPADQPFARHVECDNFQDGQAFLDGGGEQGRQLAMLAGGTYYDINPKLFDVITVANVAGAQDGLTDQHLKVIAVPIGSTGVVVTLDGVEPGLNGTDGVGPVIEGHRNFRLPWVFLARGGQRGVQQETLREGAVFALNPWFVRVVTIPTKVLILEWSDKRTSEANNFDAELERITVPIQGYRLHVDMSQTLRIPESAAPKLVSTFGGAGASALGGLVNERAPVRRFVERVLGAAVESYFNEIAAGVTVEEFLRMFGEIRIDLTTQVRNALKSWGVEAIHTTLGSFEAEDPSFNAELQRVASAQAHTRVLQVERNNVVIEDEIDEIRSRAEFRRVQLELQKTIELLGLDNATAIRMIQEIAKVPVPDTVVGNDISAIVGMLPMPILRDVIGRFKGLHSGAQPAAGEKQELTGKNSAEEDWTDGCDRDR